MIYSVSVIEHMVNDNPFNIIYLFTDVSDARDCVFHYDTNPIVESPAYMDGARCPEYDTFTSRTCNDIIYHHDDVIPDAPDYGCICDVNEHLFPR